MAIQSLFGQFSRMFGFSSSLPVESPTIQLPNDLSKLILHHLPLNRLIEVKNIPPFKDVYVSVITERAKEFGYSDEIRKDLHYVEGVEGAEMYLFKLNAIITELQKEILNWLVHYNTKTKKLDCETSLRRIQRMMPEMMFGFYRNYGSGREPLIQLFSHGLTFRDKEPDINAPLRKKMGQILLEKISNKSVIECLFLIRMGADLSLQDSLGNTFLHRDSLPLVTKCLLDKGLDPNAKNQSNHTPLHYAATRGDIAKIQLLLEKGADINAKDQLNETPLHYASKSNHTETVEFLVSYGADVTIKNIRGVLPIELTTEPKIVRILSRANPG